MEIIAKNMYDLLPQMAEAFRMAGKKTTSRNGDTTRLPGVTTVCLTSPSQRVFIDPERDCNPFFHLIESMAMLVGHNSVNLLSFFAKQMGAFTDDGETYNAFYGTRARQTWGDQIKKVVAELKAKPDTRQAVVSLWDPSDLDRTTNDKACNLLMVFSVRDGCLDMTTFNRSNDAVWGFCTGANMVHFPFFHEYVAEQLELSIGEWWHSSNNMHVYGWQQKWDKLQWQEPEDIYTRACRPSPLGSYVEGFDLALKGLMSQMERSVDIFKHITKEPHEATVLNDYLYIHPCITGLDAYPFLSETVVPMFNAYITYRWARKMLPYESKEELLAEAERAIALVDASDWQLAALFWINKRLS